MNNQLLKSFIHNNIILESRRQSILDNLFNHISVVYNSKEHDPLTVHNKLSYIQSSLYDYLRTVEPLSTTEDLRLQFLNQNNDKAKKDLEVILQGSRNKIQKTLNRKNKELKVLSPEDSSAWLAIDLVPKSKRIKASRKNSKDKTVTHNYYFTFDKSFIETPEDYVDYMKNVRNFMANCAIKFDELNNQIINKGICVYQIKTPWKNTTKFLTNRTAFDNIFNEQDSLKCYFSGVENISDVNLQTLVQEVNRIVKDLCATLNISLRKRSKSSSGFDDSGGGGSYSQIISNKMGNYLFKKIQDKPGRNPKSWGNYNFEEEYDPVKFREWINKYLKKFESVIAKDY